MRGGERQKTALIRYNEQFYFHFLGKISNKDLVGASTKYSGILVIFMYVFSMCMCVFDIFWPGLTVLPWRLQQ